VFNHHASVADASAFPRIGLTLPLKVTLFLFFTARLSFIAFHAIEDPVIQVGKRLTLGARGGSQPTLW
jgi:hypothetical protein